MIWNVHAIIHNNKYFEVGMKWILEINILCEWNVFQTEILLSISMEELVCLLLSLP